MATLDVLDWNQKKLGDVEVNPLVVESNVRKDILHTVVRWQLAKKRQGTHQAKSRGDVSGTSKKPYKQKGTGNARRGTQKSPLIAGGGVTFAPRPRDYEYDLPKKVKQLGLRSALSYLYKEGRLFVVKEMTSADGKTKDSAQKLSGFGVKKAVLIGDDNANFKRSTQNMPGFCYYPVEGLNVYDLLKYDAVILTEASVPKVEKRCGVGV